MCSATKGHAVLRVGAADVGRRLAQLGDGVGHGHAVGGEGQKAPVVEAVAKGHGALRHDADAVRQAQKRLALGGSRRLGLQKIGLAHGEGGPAQKTLVGQRHQAKHVLRLAHAEYLGRSKVQKRAQVAHGHALHPGGLLVAAGDVALRGIVEGLVGVDLHVQPVLLKEGADLARQLHIQRQLLDQAVIRPHDLRPVAPDVGQARVQLRHKRIHAGVRAAAAGNQADAAALDLGHHLDGIGAQLAAAVQQGIVQIGHDGVDGHGVPPSSVERRA